MGPGRSGELRTEPGGGASVLTEHQKEFLRQIPATVERAIADCRFYLCHATPSEPLFAYCPPGLGSLGSGVEARGRGRAAGRTHALANPAHCWGASSRQSRQLGTT